MRPLVGGLAAFGATALAKLALGKLGHERSRFLQRQAHGGRTVSLGEGLVAAAGTLAGSAVGPHPWAGLLAVGGAAGAGAVDDFCAGKFAEDPKGLRGHLEAASRGVPTRGNLKLFLICGASLLSAGALRRPADRPILDWVIRSGLIAASANIINLFDLRPGRALKVSSAGALLAVALPGERGAGECGVGERSAALRRTQGAATLATIAVCAPEDLRGSAMLGDTGANALGASLGFALASLESRPTRCGILAGLVGLTLASEKVSFTSIIENNSALRFIDQLGRR